MLTWKPQAKTHDLYMDQRGHGIKLRYKIQQLTKELELSDAIESNLIDIMYEEYLDSSINWKDV